jgi:hypothetical protein
VTDETVADSTGTTAATLRWFAGWSLAYVAAQITGVLANGLLVAADVASMASNNNHPALATEDVLSDFVWPLVPGLLIVLSAPFALALTVLWFAGRRFRSGGFRVLSLVMFLWITPLMLLSWDIGWSFWTWLIAQVVVATAMRPPRLHPGRTGE